MAQHTFISYAHEDSHFVLKLAHQLRRQGVAVWVDQWHISADVEWGKAIERAVKSCQAFLIVLSPAALNSWVVREQFLWATTSGKPIMAVVYQSCQVPPILQEVPAIDFTGQNQKAALRQLLAYYLPEQEVRVEYWSKLKAVWNNLDWSWWDRLLPLLWPGWLGPSFLLFLLVVSSMLFWSRDADTLSAPQPTPEMLAVVPSTPTPLSLPTPLNVRVRSEDGQAVLYVPAGEFLMGSTGDDELVDEDEKPQRRVYVDAYWIDKTEITNRQYQLCVVAGVCAPPRSQGQRFEAADQPVVGVDWSQATDYCQWVGGRLPTEAEWEKAARGTDGRSYPWGNRFDGTRVNFCDINCVADWKDRGVNDGYALTAPVGSYPTGASPYGVLDMSGNVWEWTADWYGPNYYSQGINENPVGPLTGQQRVVRGGSWLYYGKNLRVSRRHKDSPTYRYDNIGFRCVVDGNNR